MGNGLTETRTFTSRYFPSSITLGGLLSWNYSTDNVGNILSIVDTLNPAANRTYGYQDIHYFLTQGNGPWGPRAWTCDKIGNRLTEARGAVTDTYSYLPSPGGRTPILSQIQLGAGGTRGYQYGPAGHLEKITAGTDRTIFRNDEAGRLAGIEKSDASVSFRYDGRSYLNLADADALPFLDGFERGDLAKKTMTPLPATPPVTHSRPLEAPEIVPSSLTRWRAMRSGRHGAFHVPQEVAMKRVFRLSALVLTLSAMFSLPKGADAIDYFWGSCSMTCERCWSGSGCPDFLGRRQTCYRYCP